MSARASLLASSLAAHLVLFGAAATNAAWAEDSAPASNQSDALAHSAGGGQQQGGNSDTGSGANGAATDVHINGTGDAGAKGDPATKGGADTGRDEHADDHPGAKHTGFEANPIDTSMSVRSRFDPKRTLNMPDWKKPKFGRSPTILSDHRRTLMRARKTGVVRNAIGQPLRHTDVDVKGTDVKASERSSLDGTPNNINHAGNGGTEAGGIDTHRQGFVPLHAGGVEPRDPRTNTAMNHSIINGRDMVHPGIGAGAVGGPAKNVPGVINGTTFRPRHP